MTMKKEVLHILVLIGVIIAICFVGQYDYADEVIYHMSTGTYEVLREKLGNVSTTELVDTYMSDKAYWDLLGMMR